MTDIDPKNLKMVKEWSRPETFFSLARQVDSTKLFAGASNAKIWQFDISAEKPDPVEFSGHEGYVTGLALCNKMLVSGASDGKLIWWDTESRSILRTNDAHQKWVRQVVAIGDGNLVASVGDDMVCRVWETSSGNMVHELRGHEPKTPQHFPSMLYAVTATKDGQFLATGDRVGRIIVWEVATGKQAGVLDAPLMYTWDPKQRIHSIGGIRSLAFSPDNRLLVVGGTGQIGNIDHLEALARIEIFDWKKSERLLELPGDTYKGLVERLVFDPTGRWIVAVGGDQNGFIKFIDPASGKVLKQDKAPMHVHDVVNVDSSETLVAVGNGKLVVWSLTT